MKKVAVLLEENHQKIIDDWEKIVLDDVPAASKSNRIALHDHIPNILDDIIDILHRHNHLDHYLDDPKIEQIEQNSIEHGRHRATSSDYTVDQILHEYMVFQNVIEELMNENDITNQGIHQLFKSCIDNAMLKSVTSFSESIQEMQNKLIGTLAHDIRNPLAAARMATEMFDFSAGEERFLKVKKMTYNSINKSIELLEGLLESVSIKAGEGMMLNFRELNIYEDLYTVYREASEVYSEKINFECDDQNLIGIYDPVSIRRLLENLITNAVKYGDSFQPITISVENHNPEAIEISVHNYGKPIPKRKQEEIFSFLDHGISNKTKQYQSYGMGLTLVKMVATAHDGKVDLTSDEKLGTKFSISLNKKAAQPGKMRAKLNKAG